MTKKELAIEITRVLFNSKNVIKEDNWHVKRLMRKGKPELLDLYKMAEGAEAGKKKMEEKNKVKRSHESMAKEFISKPHDVYTILHTSGVLCNTISVRVTNEKFDEDFYLTFKNEMDAWKTLKELTEIHTRKVLYKIDDNEPIKFEDSKPYKARFDEKYIRLNGKGGLKNYS